MGGDKLFALHTEETLSQIIKLKPKKDQSKET